MLSRKYLLSVLTNHRLISTSCCLQKNGSLNKQVHMMKKIMAGREKGKRRFIYNENLPKMESVKKISDGRGQPKESNRRVTVLNKLFMKNITDLMATDSFARDVSGYGIQVSMVKVSPDFNSVNVFWLAQADENDKVVDDLLKSIAGPLRHELSQLRLMGEVPKIFFVKDKNYSKAAEVDILLSKADFGEDFKPTDPTLFMRAKPQLHMKLSEDIKKRIQEIEKIPMEEEEDEELPEMRHDVLGIDHLKIMKKIATSIDSTKRAWENFETKNDSSQSSGIFSPDFSEARGRIEKLQNDENIRETFMTYLRKKQIESHKKHKNIILQDQSIEDLEDEDLNDHQDDEEDDYEYNSQGFERDDDYK